MNETKVKKKRYTYPLCFLVFNHAVLELCSLHFKLKYDKSTICVPNLPGFRSLLLFNAFLFIFHSGLVHDLDKCC